MQALTSKKAIIAILSLGSIVLAGTIKDIRSHSVKTALIETEQELSAVERSVASLEVARVAQLYLPLNPENSAKIDGEWEVTRKIGADEKVIFDKSANPEDAENIMKVELKLVGNSKVLLNNDSQTTYNVSLLSDFGTIAIYKKVGNGFEILEAKKIVNASNNTLVVDEEVDLVLERALLNPNNQSKSNNVIKGNDVVGQVKLTSKAISKLEVDITNENGESHNIQIEYADLKDGGSFSAEVNGEMVSGVVLNNGKDGYRISFVTGPLAGAMLNFTTSEQADKIQETERDQDVVKEESAPVETEVKNANEAAVEERKDGNEMVDENPVVLTEEQVKETAEQNGYSF